MDKIKLILMVVLLVPVFVVGTLLSPLMLLIRPVNTFKAMNRLCGAAWLGFDGKNTISKTCGMRLQAGIKCSVCESICKRLAKLDPLHCEKEVD